MVRATGSEGGAGWRRSEGRTLVAASLHLRCHVDMRVATRSDPSGAMVCRKRSAASSGVPMPSNLSSNRQGRTTVAASGFSGVPRETEDRTSPSGPEPDCAYRKPGRMGATMTLRLVSPLQRQ